MSTTATGLRNRRSFGAIDKRMKQKEDDHANNNKASSSTHSTTSSSNAQQLDPILALLQPASLDMLQKFPEGKRTRLLQQLAKALLLVRASSSSVVAGGSGTNQAKEGDEEEAENVPRRVVDGSGAAPAFDELQRRIIRDFESRLAIELEALNRTRVLAEQLRKDDVHARRVALALTLLVIALTIGVAVYLSDDRRFYLFHQTLAKWYYYVFVRQGAGLSGGKEGLFLDESEGQTYDLYE